ncbi:MAG: amidohydrolase family protein [Fidelibacterota bacterium]
MIRLALLILVSFGGAQIAPTEGLYDRTPRVFFLKGPTIVTEPDRVIPSGEIVIRDGLIESVGRVARVPADAFEIDLTGKTVYAGFIESYLVAAPPAAGESRPSPPGRNGPAKEAEETATEHWNPRVRPERSALEGFEPGAEKLEGLRKAGFTAAHVVPPDGIFRGSSALVHLDEWSQNSIIAEDGPAQILAFEHGGWGDTQYPNSLLGAIALMRQTFIDAQWYERAHEIYRRFPHDNEQPEVNRALEALEQQMDQGRAFCFEVDSELDALRAGRISREFDLNLWLKGSGYEYRRLREIGALNPFVILPVSFPPKPNVDTWERALQYTQAQLRHWDQAPDNAARMKRAGIPFSFTSHGLKDLSDFRRNVIRSIQRGLPPEDALASLTTIPARYLGLSDYLGTIEPGKIANLVVTDGDYFNRESDVLEVWIRGTRYRLKIEPVEELRGKWGLRWEFDGNVRTDTLNIEGEKEKPEGTLVADTLVIDLESLVLEENGAVSILVKGDTLGLEGIVRFSGMVKGDRAWGHGRTPDGKAIEWEANRVAPYEPSKPEKKAPVERPSELTVTYPDGAYGFEAPPVQPPLVLVKNATIWTCGPQGILEDADLLVKQGKIWRVGRNLKISRAIDDAVIIDARGKHVTPGLIDAHSHTAASSVNEATQAVTAEVRIEDVLNSNDINIYRELAGGLTVANVLHGSANPIGGQNAVIKLRWGEPPEGLLLEGAPGGIKFALGENVKQSNWGDKYTSRYPQTRMGVEQLIRDALTAAREYRRRWEDHRGTRAASLKKIPPRRDLELEALAEVLEGKRLVHSHSYRQDEILMLIRVAEDFGFRIGTFQHVLEGYKIAEAIMKHGAGASTFSDWWAYKFEVFDAIPFNGPLMHQVGVVTSYNSDSSELARRLNTEAAKAVKYGGVSEEDALKFVTLYPAVQLGIDDRVGSLEKGKDGDFVIWSGHPLSTYTVCEQTWIDGKNYFSRVRDQSMSRKLATERNDLIQKILEFKENSGGLAVEKMP